MFASLDDVDEMRSTLDDVDEMRSTLDDVDEMRSTLKGKNLLLQEQILSLKS